MDAAPAVLGAFGEKLSTVARNQLTRIGVDVQLGVNVVGVDNTGVDVIEPDGTARRVSAPARSPPTASDASRRATRLDRAGSASKTALRPRVLAHAGAGARAGACPVRAGAGVRKVRAGSRFLTAPRSGNDLVAPARNLERGQVPARFRYVLSGSDSIERRPR